MKIAGALVGTDQLAELLDTISAVRQLIGDKTDISVPGALASLPLRVTSRKLLHWVCWIWHMVSCTWQTIREWQITRALMHKCILCIFIRTLSLRMHLQACIFNAL
jgi:hypothetical protein